MGRKLKYVLGSSPNFTVEPREDAIVNLALDKTVTKMSTVCVTFRLAVRKRGKIYKQQIRIVMPSSHTGSIPLQWISKQKVLCQKRRKCSRRAASPVDLRLSVSVNQSKQKYLVRV